MIARTTRGHHGIADYLLTGKRSDSKLTREQKDRVVPLYGNLEVFKATEKYINKYKNYKDVTTNFQIIVIFVTSSIR